MVGRQGRVGSLISQVLREQTAPIDFGVICGHSVTSDKTGFEIVKKKRLSILKTIPLCNSTSVETLKGQMVSKKKTQKMHLKYTWRKGTQ